MEKKFDISNLDNNTLDQYESFLKKFNVWTEYKRELKLSTLLNEGKKIEFTVNIESSRFGSSPFIDIVEDEQNDSQLMNASLSNACATIKDVKFILNGNNVESLEVNVNFLDTPFGKVCKRLLEEGLLLVLKQSMLRQWNDNGELSDKGNFIKFYITYPDKSDIRDEKIKEILKK